MADDDISWGSIKSCDISFLCLCFNLICMSALPSKSSVSTNIKQSTFCLFALTYHRESCTSHGYHMHTAWVSHEHHMNMQYLQILNKAYTAFLPVFLGQSSPKVKGCINKHNVVDITFKHKRALVVCLLFQIYSVAKGSIYY